MTGASGFVGRHLVAHLRDCSDDVVPTDRSDGGPDMLDADGLATLVAEARPEVVYHLAGQADVAASWLAPIETMRSNVEGTHNILEVARTHGVAKVLTVSSADIYGVVDPEELPIDEGAALRPVSPYAASKAAVKVDGEALRGRLATDGIVVSVICPGYVRSRMTEKNDFPMPFLMDAEPAAAIIKRGLGRGKARICFPLPMHFAAWLLGTLPPTWTDPIVSRIPRKE